MSTLRLAQPDGVKLADSVVPARVYLAEEIGRMLKTSAKTIHLWADSGAMPRPIRLGRVVRFNIQVINDWISAGCPRPKKG